MNFCDIIQIQIFLNTFISRKDFLMTFHLGIDIGTTSVAVIVIDPNSFQVASVFESPHDAYVINENGYAEQDIGKLLECTIGLIKRFSNEILSQITTIGVAGQMHGIMLWNEEQTTNLITWQDQRASKSGRLKEIQKIPGCQALKDGFGFTSLAILSQDGKISNFTHCGTIMDYIVWILLGKPKESFIDSTNAASWGLFNILSNEWDTNIIKSLNIPLEILPTIKQPGSIIGKLNKEYANQIGLGMLKDEVMIKCPIGDNQASVIGSSINVFEEIFVTVGTGSQLSIVIDKSEISALEPSTKYEIRPFSKSKVLIVTAPLCGGQAWEILKDMTKEILTKFLDNSLTDEQIYKKLNELALQELNSNDLPIIEPHFLGERWDPESKGAITNLTLQNFSIGKIAAAMALGMAKNLKGNIPDKCFKNRKILLANGAAIRKNEVLAKAFEIVFGMEVINAQRIEETAIGAAIVKSE
ncbi:FGGY family of carbohydrate kinase, N-terminal domain containing protein [Tritrichomonas foetus]|uniref:FGGY family of carbohydrate kinase, N-terminal domain containing protein n=1 Tax=Tritrichomonas foetus TaxID=1144522 RepID=A0A1J4KC83_9EUKA|nr:FGGY family of carbohydrate kinase, N-terminal domain containing protein [Tritrichomonas foetus]|eukprot:OHT07069.1 FGGY family of carbohydrate kinase, N-terminal domain containing protein [Tritrichomonas foetus]